MPTHQVTSHQVTSHDDIILNIETHGHRDHPALLFSNSLGTTLRMWQPQIESLKNEFYLITYDTRGHGASGDTRDHRWTLSDLGKDVITILDSLNVTKASFCGISMGGMTGQWLGIHHSDRFNHLIVSNTAAKIGQKEAWEARVQQVRDHGLNAIAESAPSRWFSASFINAHPKSVQDLVEQMKAGSAEGYANCCEALADADVRDHVAQITAPTLVIGGEYDPVTTVEDAAWLAENIGDNATLNTVPASHIANIEAKNEFTQLIRDFISH